MLVVEGLGKYCLLFQLSNKILNDVTILQIAT